jgi:hypothetical protein
MKHGIPQESIPEPLLFTICINNLPLRINLVSEPILFTDDTSDIISSRNFKDFCLVSNSVLSDMILTYKLILNLDKMNIMIFITKNSSHSILCIGYKEKYRVDSKYKISWFKNQ